MESTPFRLRAALLQKCGRTATSQTRRRPTPITLLAFRLPKTALPSRLLQTSEVQFSPSPQRGEFPSRARRRFTCTSLHLLLHSASALLQALPLNGPPLASKESPLWHQFGLATASANQAASKRSECSLFRR